MVCCIFCVTWFSTWSTRTAKVRKSSRTPPRAVCTSPRIASRMASKERLGVGCSAARLFCGEPPSTVGISVCMSPAEFVDAIAPTM